MRQGRFVLWVCAAAGAATTGVASAGITNINISGALGNNNWDNSAGWHQGQQWGWYFPDPGITTQATGWTIENWIAGGPASLTVQIDANTDPDVTMTKNLINTTGFAWTSFIIQLNQISPFPTPSTYPGSLGSSRFSSNSTVNGPTGSTMTFTQSGTDTPVLPGQSVSFFFTFNIPGSVVFEMVQTPVPTPGALGLLGLGGLAALRRRR